VHYTGFNNILEHVEVGFRLRQQGTCVNGHSLVKNAFPRLLYGWKIGD
jgi:hypothetical protein